MPSKRPSTSPRQCTRSLNGPGTDSHGCCRVSPAGVPVQYFQHLAALGKRDLGDVLPRLVGFTGTAI